MLSSIFVARHLGPENYGRYIFVMLVFAYFENFGQFRTSVSILPYLKNNRDHESAIFSLGLILIGIMSISTVLSMLATAKYFGLLADYSSLVYLYLSIMIISEYVLVFTAYGMVYKDKYKLMSVLQMLRYIIQTIGFAYIFFIVEDAVLINYLVVISLTSLITAIVTLYYVKDFIKYSLTGLGNINYKLYFKLSLNFYLTNFVNFFSKKGVATFVAAKMSIPNLAFFNMLFSHFDLLRFPNSALGAMMFPALSKETSQEKQREYIKRKIKFNIAIYVPILTLAYFMYPVLVILFYGEEYSVITEYFPYVLLIGGPYLVFYPIIHYFSSNGLPQYEGYILLISLTIQMLAVLLFVYYGEFTLFNAVIAQAIGFIIFMAALNYFYMVNPHRSKKS
jgi:O-antigen/teichoic acid export membrane protein